MTKTKVKLSTQRYHATVGLVCVDVELEPLGVEDQQSPSAWSEPIEVAQDELSAHELSRTGDVAASVALVLIRAAVIVPGYGVPLENWRQAVVDVAPSDRQTASWSFTDMPPSLRPSRRHPIASRYRAIGGQELSRTGC